MRGRKPRPTSRQVADGDPRKKGRNKLERVLKGEPQATGGLPACPRHLRGHARAAWGFWVKELEAMNLDHRPDAQMLEGACVAYEQAVAAYNTVQKQGRFIEKVVLDPISKQLVIVDIKTHPAVRQGNQSWLLLKSFCSEFGLSPVSRTRLAIEKPADGSADLMAILSQPREQRKPFVQ